jgi:hypothetical protein
MMKKLLKRFAWDFFGLLFEKVETL